jgi:hypothetical protein
MNIRTCSSCDMVNHVRVGPVSLLFTSLAFFVQQYRSNLMSHGIYALLFALVHCSILLCKVYSDALSLISSSTLLHFPQCARNCMAGIKIFNWASWPI